MRDSARAWGLYLHFNWVLSLIDECEGDL